MGSCFHKITESCAVCDTGYVGEMNLLIARNKTLDAEKALLVKALTIIVDHKPTAEACETIAAHALGEIHRVCRTD